MSELPSFEDHDDAVVQEQVTNPTTKIGSRLLLSCAHHSAILGCAVPIGHVASAEKNLTDFSGHFVLLLVSDSNLTQDKHSCVGMLMAAQAAPCLCIIQVPKQSAHAI